MLKKLSFIFYTLSCLLLLILNVASSFNINLDNNIALTLSGIFWFILIVGIALTVTHILKVGNDGSGYFKKTKIIDSILLGTALLFFIGNFLKIDLIVAIAFPLIIYFFLLHILFNTKD